MVYVILVGLIFVMLCNQSKLSNLKIILVFIYFKTAILDIFLVKEKHVFAVGLLTLASICLLLF